MLALAFAAARIASGRFLRDAITNGIFEFLQIGFIRGLEQILVVPAFLDCLFDAQF